MRPYEYYMSLRASRAYAGIAENYEGLRENVSRQAWFLYMVYWQEKSEEEPDDVLYWLSPLGM